MAAGDRVRVAVPLVFATPCPRGTARARRAGENLDAAESAPCALRCRRRAQVRTLPSRRVGIDSALSHRLRVCWSSEKEKLPDPVVHGVPDMLIRGTAQHRDRGHPWRGATLQLRTAA